MTKVYEAVLVYQGGIANVFQVSPDQPPRRLLQSDFRTCESYAAGLEAAGVLVDMAYCNRAGDIAAVPWDILREHAPFSDRFCFGEER